MIIYASDTLVGEMLFQLIQDTISKQGECHMVFPGGSSPWNIFNILREKKLDWHALHLYPSDERCAPVGSVNRNDRLIDELILPYVPFPEKNLHRIPAELGPDRGAFEYQRILNDTPRFDIAFLGMGEDGHTASLFQSAMLVNDSRSVVPVHKAEKLPSERVSIGFSRLLDAKERWVLVNTTQKKKIIEAMRNGFDYPVARIKPTLFLIISEYSM